MVRAENFILFWTYAMLIKKAFILVKNLEVSQYNYTTTPKYLTEWQGLKNIYTQSWFVQ